MTRIRIPLAVVGLLAALGFAVAAPASAGTNNGTSNWYWHKSCSANGGFFDVTNYDIKSGTWQQWHVDADRRGGTGDVPRVYIDGYRSGYWNDFYVSEAGIWAKATFKVVFADGSSCSIYG